MENAPDMWWYGRMLEKDSAARRLNYCQKSSIIEQSMQEAERQRLRVEKEFGDKTALACIKELGFQVEREEPEAMPSFLYMGMMEPGERIVRFNETVLSLGEAYLAARFGREAAICVRFREIVAWHELYHCLEEETPGIYTRRAAARIHIAGPLWRSRRVEAASEIGAVHFSKLAAGVSFCPCLYTHYLLAATKQDMEVEDAF